MIKINILKNNIKSLNKMKKIINKKIIKMIKNLLKFKKKITFNKIIFLKMILIY